MNKLRASTIRQVQWHEVREQVRQLDHELFVAMEGVSPDAEHQLFEVCYPYGALIIDDQGQFCLPDEQGQLQSIHSGNLSANIVDQLGYNMPGIAMGLILQGETNLFTEGEQAFKKEKVIYSSIIFEKGEIFPLNRVLDQPHTRQVVNLWRMSAGARTPYLMPSIANKAKFSKLADAFALSNRAPQQMQQHWSLFRAMHNHPDFPNPWYAKILFFGKNWVMHKDSVAKKLFRLVLHERLVEQTKFSRNTFQFDKFNNINKVLRRLYKRKFDHHLGNMLRYLFEVACGHAVAYQISDARSAGPFDSYARILSDLYGLEKHAPIILTPTQVDKRSLSNQTVYVSLGLATVDFFRDNIVNNQGVLNDLRALSTVVSHIVAENIEAGIRNTNLLNVERFLYQFFAVDVKENGLLNASTIFDDDPRVKRWRTEQLQQTYAYNDFLRACVKIRKK